MRTARRQLRCMAHHCLLQVVMRRVTVCVQQQCIPTGLHECLHPDSPYRIQQEATLSRSAFKPIFLPAPTHQGNFLAAPISRRVVTHLNLLDQALKRACPASPVRQRRACPMKKISIRPLQPWAVHHQGKELGPSMVILWMVVPYLGLHFQ